MKTLVNHQTGEIAYFDTYLNTIQFSESKDVYKAVITKDPDSRKIVKISVSAIPTSDKPVEIMKKDVKAVVEKAETIMEKEIDAAVNMIMKKVTVKKTAPAEEPEIVLIDKETPLCLQTPAYIMALRSIRWPDYVDPYSGLPIEGPDEDCPNINFYVGPTIDQIYG